ncbi:hypothetical protein ACQUY5_29270 [Bacillus cereus]|uniref:hypothetical protein n=1 Tax=Bacillus cereus TaxID=1396 RepID=UPI003D185BD0
MGLKKVTLTQVKSAVKKNKSWNGYVAPNKVAEFHITQGWHIGIPVYLTDRQGTIVVNGDRDIDTFLSYFKAYNCNSELGTGVAYWEVTN